jgi:Uma2 family endonuclease
MGMLVMAVQPSRKLLTVADYYRLAKVGELPADAQVELIEGKLVEMPPIGPGHADAVDIVADLLRERIGRRARIRVQNPLRLSARTEVQPDIAIVQLPEERAQSYAEAHPTAADTILVVEVAGSSLAFDLGEKARLYARHGVLELWVLDLQGHRLLVHREPTPNGYASVEALAHRAPISPLGFPDIELTAGELFG